MRQDLPKICIASSTDTFLTATYERTPYTRIKTTLTFPEGYPNRPLIVNVASDQVVPPGLKKKLERDLEKVALDLTGRGQVCAVFQRLVTFVDTNKFVPCWRELKQCVDLVSGGQKGDAESRQEKTNSQTISIIEPKGKIKITLWSQKYFYRFSVVIDDGYPSTSRHEDYGMPCRFEMQSTNFPPKIESLLTSQGKELVRRMQDGMSTEEALKMSNPVRLPKTFKAGAHEPVKMRLTQEAVKGLKKDTETLSAVRDLRDVDAATKQGDARVKLHSKKERKDARRMIHKITDREIAKDSEQEEKERHWQMEEKARMAGYNLTEFDGSNPQPSLLTLVKFLVREVKRLPNEHCPVCAKLTLPNNPDDLQALYQSSSDAKTEKEKRARRAAKLRRPMRTYCGCWYHYNCLDKFLREPPFGAECRTAGCGRRVYHNEWPGDMKELERAWAAKQARAREIEDAAMFL